MVFSVIRGRRGDGLTIYNYNFIFRWVQETYDLPPGALTESTIETGHKVTKMARKRFSRKMSYSKEHRDILQRGLWTSDPILHYESTVLQNFQPGNIRKSKKKKRNILENAQNFVYEELLVKMVRMVREVASEVIEEENIHKDEREIPEIEDEF